MKTRIQLLVVTITLLFLLAFTVKQDNPSLKITAKDVKLKIPKLFPKPHYDFSNNKLSPEVFTLGRQLFYDPILSKDNSVSCATCHQRIAAFAHIDHPLSHGIYAKIGTRNVPALQNLIWKDTYMWDGGVNNLEVQPINPITNPIEMDETLENVINKLKNNKDYCVLFKNAFKDTLINSERLLKSLTQFTGLMISSNSRYDKFITRKGTLSNNELLGLEIFKSKCSSCHTEPLFTNNTYQSNELPIDTTLNDIGRGKITGLSSDNYLFKTPSLRNCELTYPYMHDGRFRGLKEVLNYYGNPNNFKNSLNAELKKIGYLTEEDKNNLLSFLKTLTDKEFIYDVRFADPNPPLY